MVRHHAWTHSAALLRDTYDKLIGHEDPTLRMNKRETKKLVTRVHESQEETSEEEKGET